MNFETIMPKSEAPMVIFRIRKSPWYIIGPLLMLGLTLLMCLLVLIYVIEGSPTIRSLFALVFSFLFIMSAFILYLDWSMTYYILTDHTVERTTGVLGKSKTYVSLHDLSKIDCKFGIIGNIFNYGTIIIESETADMPLSLIGVPSPHQVMDLIREARAHVPKTV